MGTRPQPAVAQGRHKCTKPTPTHIHHVELFHLLDFSKICPCSFISLSQCRRLSEDENMDVSNWAQVAVLAADKGQELVLAG